MRINDLTRLKCFNIHTKKHHNTIISGVFCGDLLSLVMANIKENNILLTVISNFNVLAVAHLMKIPCIILTSGITPKKELLEKAEEENIAIVTTFLDTASAIKLIYETFSI